MISRRHFLGTATAVWLAGQSAVAADGSVLVFGGNRDTGLEVVKTLVDKGDEVTVFVRPTSDVADLKRLNVALVTGDALNPDDVRRALAAGPFRAVVSTLGGKRGEPRPDFEGVKNVVDAAKAASVKRMVLVTALGVGDSEKAVGPDVHRVLGAVFAAKAQGENYLKESGLIYTIIRPGGLRSGIQTGEGVLTEDKTVGGDIYREDLGLLTAGVIDDAKTFNKVYSAVDKEMIQTQPLELRPGSPETPL